MQEPLLTTDSNLGGVPRTNLFGTAYPLENQQSFAPMQTAMNKSQSFDSEQANSSLNDEEQQEESNLLDCIDNKRTKERQIKFVVEKVSLWRKLYNGVDLGTGETIRYSLEDAARLVGISKKSLDDYLLQLRFGRMYGFEFLQK
jgi:hypothetical protein